ncbi:MAG TPA: hypothetical protein VM095_16340 [Pyrinomonadaceae bacterium]|nr:hypothetical protein [Pyrinomonadaceae bacterium]
MRRLILYSLATLMIVNGTTTAPASFSDHADSDPCDVFKMIIITPPRDIDFKIILIPVPKELDKAMVFNPCQQSNVGSAVIIPQEKKDESLKVPPFTINKKISP